MQHELVIVGGGVVGTTLAYLAAKLHPAWSLVLVERSQVGSGASAASAGYDAVESANPKLRELAIRSRLLYQSMAHDVPEARVRKLRTLWVVDRQDAASFPRNFVTGGLDSVKIQQSNASALPAGFAHHDHACLFEENESGYANVRALCEGIVGYLGRCHPRFRCYERTAARSLHTVPLGYELNLATGSSLQARRIVLALGAWLCGSAFGKTAHQHPPLRIKKVASLRISSKPVESSPAIVYRSHGAFFMPLPEKGEWVFSFTLDSWDCSPETCTMLESFELDQGLRQLDALAPGMSSCVSGADVSCDAYTSDRVPLQTLMTSDSKILTITGCSGAGYRTAPALAQDALLALSPIRANSAGI